MGQFMGRKIIKHEGARSPGAEQDNEPTTDFDFVAELHELVLDSTEQCPECHERVTAAIDEFCETRGTLPLSRPGVQRNGRQENR